MSSTARRSNGLCKAGGSEGDVRITGKGKTVYTPELADVEGEVGLPNDDGVVGGWRRSRPGGLGQQGELGQRLQPK